MKRFNYYFFFFNGSMQKMINKTVVLFIVVCFFMKPFISFSQTLDEIVPVSPNASSLETFGNVPVGPYTGVPDIQIPIYNIVVDNVTIPIKLQYHPGNVKKESVASWVGLGWSLNAGGMIGHTINGLDDFYSYQSNRYLSGQAINYIPKENESSKIQGVINNYPFVDTEPDIYSFHIGDHSGTMFFKNQIMNEVQQDNVSPIIQSKGNPLKVSYNYRQGTWTIIDGNGNTYYFGTPEYTYPHSNSEYCDNHQVCNYNFRQQTYNPGTKSDGNKQNTAWTLDSIKTHLDHKIRFKYKDDYVTNYPSYSERKAYILEHDGTLWDGTVPFFNYFALTYSSSVSLQKILKEIEFPHGKIEFETVDRRDVYGIYTDNSSKVTSPQCLSAIKIYSMDQSLVRKFTFQMEERQTGSGFNKIFLTEVMKPDASKYIFNYKSSHSGIAYSVDYWGYENGKSRGFEKSSDIGYPAPNGWGTFIPSMLIKKKDSYQYLFGADRTPDVNYATNDLLTQITYPMKGETRFTYELNDFSNTSYLDISRMRLADYSLVSTTGYMGGNNEFVLDSDESLVYITGRIQYSSSGTSMNPYLCPYLELRENTASGTVVYASVMNGDPACKPFTLKKGKYVMVLKDQDRREINGDYIRKLREEYGVSYMISEISKITSDKCSKGGGLRIKRIEDYDSNNSLVQKREFVYEKDGKSTGRLMSNLDFFKILSFKYRYEPIASKPEWDGLVRYYVMTYDYTASASVAFVSSVSYIPSMPSAAGSYVGYDYVEEHLYGPTKYEGMNRYYYYNKEDSVLYNQFYMEQYPTLSDPMNGSLLEQQVCDAESRILRTTKYEYETNCLQEQTQGLSIFIFYGKESESNRPGFYKEYPVYGQWNRMSKMTEHTYVNNVQLQPTLETYSYNEDNYQKNQVKVLSNNKERVITYQYPTNAGSNSVLEQMKKKNIVLPIVEEKKYTNGSLVEFIQREYKQEYNHFVPKAVRTSHRSNSPLKEDISYPYYNKSGYPCQINADEIPTTILWSYNDSRPIVTIQGITYPEVRTILGDNLINRLSQTNFPLESDCNTVREKLKDHGWVTVYVYDSWGNTCRIINPRGITETYEYDSVGRLIGRKDHKGSLLDKFEYHYKP